MMPPLNRASSEIDCVARGTFPATVKKLLETAQRIEGDMAGGRPSQGKQQRYEELEGLAAWFHQALRDAGFSSVNEFLSAGLFEKNAVYGVFNATRLLTLESTQSLAVALQRNPAEVEPVWLRAKEDRDKDILAVERAAQPRLTSWSSAPLPSLALRNLLEAQSMAVDRLPYALLGVDEPPLSTVYVAQQVRVKNTSGREGNGPKELPAEPRPSAKRLQPVLSVSEALERHDHLLITGEPGAGKSTLSNYIARALSLIWLREESAAHAPLSEPTIPLRVFARSLNSDQSWSAVLAKAACLSLGRSLLQDPNPSLFAGRVQGARWIILVDGLDEVADARARTEIIRTVAQHARTGTDYRFILTTRALPESELAPILMSNVGNYAIQPFGRAELEKFARRWFTAQDPKSQAKQTDRFLRETSDGRLQELVRNPLLATIAAVSSIKDPDRPLPTSRLSLYERFCGYLWRDRSGSRRTTEYLRQTRDIDVERFNFVQWLHSRRLELLAELASRRLAGQEPLWAAAESWVESQVAEGASLIDGWKECLWEELVSTGLLVTAEKELQFLHQSFAEYLAAQSHAQAIGADFPNMDAWIARGLRDAERTFALFTFATWAGKPEHNIGIVIDRLLESYNPYRLIFASRLIAEGVTVPSESIERVVSRLVALARNIGDSDLAIEAIDVLGIIFDHPPVIDQLDMLASLSNLPVSKRMAAILALERLGADEKAKEYLTQLLPSCYATLLRRAVPMAIRIGEPAIAQVRHRVDSMVAEPDSDSDDRAGAVEVLRDLGSESDVEVMARSVLTCASASSSDLRRSAEAWHDVAGESAVVQIATLTHDRPDHDYKGRAELASFLRRVGDSSTAVTIASALMQGKDSDPDSVIQAAEILLRIQGSAALEEVEKRIDQWSDAESFWHKSRLMGHVMEIAPKPSLVAVIKDLLAGWVPLGSHHLIKGWLIAEGPKAPRRIIDAIKGGANLDLYDCIYGADHFREAGAQSEAQQLAEYAFTSISEGNRDWYLKAAEVFLKADPIVGAETLLNLAQDHPLHSASLAGMLDALTEHHGIEIERTTLKVAAKLAAHPQAKGEELRDALFTQLALGGAQYANSLAQTIVDQDRLFFDQRKELAKALAAVGEDVLALKVWSILLQCQEYTLAADIDLVDDLMSAGLGSWACNEVGGLLSNSALAARRRHRLKQMMAVLTTD